MEVCVTFSNWQETFTQQTCLMQFPKLFLQFVLSSDGNLRQEQKERSIFHSFYLFTIYLSLESDTILIKLQVNPHNLLILVRCWQNCFPFFLLRGFRRRQQHCSDVPNRQWPASGQQRHSGFLDASPPEVSRHSLLILNHAYRKHY